jgi:hypothetical protein
MVISREQGRFAAKDLPPGQHRVQAIGGVRAAAAKRGQGWPCLAVSAKSTLALSPALTLTFSNQRG